MRGSAQLTRQYIKTFKTLALKTNPCHMQHVSQYSVDPVTCDNDQPLQSRRVCKLPNTNSINSKQPSCKFQAVVDYMLFATLQYLLTCRKSIINLLRHLNVFYCIWFSIRHTEAYNCRNGLMYKIRLLVAGGFWDRIVSCLASIMSSSYTLTSVIIDAQY